MKKLIICALCAICGFTTANAQGKFGHVNTQEVMQAKGEAFDKESATLPENIKQRRQQELQDMYTKIQQSYQDNQQALQKASQEKMQAIQTKILDAIKAVGQAGQYVYIMENNSLPYISTSLSTDVTAQVKAKLGLK